MNRRAWLKRSAAALAGCCFAQPARAVEVAEIVDAHTHFYDPSRPQGVPWPEQGTPLYRTVLPADWRAVAAPLGVTKTVVIESSPWLEDNQWLLDLAAHEPAIVAVIGNLNFGDAKFAENLERFAVNPLFRGLRAREKFADADLARGSQLLAERGLALDMNGEPGFVADAVRLAKKVSELRLVIDHVGAAGDARTLSDQWKDDIRRAADQPNVFLKISGLVEQADALAGAAPHELNAYLPILDFVWNRFGEDRLIFASNWPVSEKGATYEVLFGIAREFFASKGKTATEKFFRTNSRAVYRWLDRR